MNAGIPDEHTVSVMPKEEKKESHWGKKMADVRGRRSNSCRGGKLQEVVREGGAREKKSRKENEHVLLLRRIVGKTGEGLNGVV